MRARVPRAAFTNPGTRRVIAAFLFTALAVFLLFNAWLISCGFRGCASAAEIRAFVPSEGGLILDRNGAELGRMDAVRRENVELDSVPQHVRDAFVVTEDRRFFSHRGLDFRGVGRAIWRNVRAGEMREGFSTITMQLARNTFLPPARAGNDLRRKLLELRMARVIEGALEKEEILELYLNAIYMGSGVYGVQGASRDLFGKSVSELTVAEGALLAALPKAPTTYNPRNSPERAAQRRRVVLRLMADAELISDSTFAASDAAPVTPHTAQWASAAAEPSALSPVRAFVDSVLQLQQRQGEDVVVHSTVDAMAQRAADSALARRGAQIQRESDAWHGSRKGDVQGAMIAIDPSTGGIVALVGAVRYERGAFHRALVARRQPGSAFKPFVFAAALAKGIPVSAILEDEPISIQSEGKMWTPANFGAEYRGKISMRTALATSANAATVRLSRLVGEQQVVEVARRNGIASELSAVPSIALGSMDVTPLELVSAYVPFANGGFRVTPHLVTSITTRDGAVIWTGAAPRTRVMDERDAFLLTSMLITAVNEGTGTALRAAGVRSIVAGKTGTSNDATDLWFVGYTPTVVAGFWFGYDQPLQISAAATGGRHAAPAWAEFYLRGWREEGDGQSWDPPPGLSLLKIDTETGELAGQWCPHVRDEYFKVGTEPTVACTVHGPAPRTLLQRLGKSIGKALGGLFGKKGGGGE